MLHDMPSNIEQPDNDQPLHVLVCPDTRTWAFDNIANNISRHAGHNRISKLYMSDVIGNERLFFETIFLKRIDLCHIFWREDFFHLFHPHTMASAASQLGLDYDSMVRAINSCAFTTSVYDHLFSASQDIQSRRAGFALIDGYTVSSEKLRSIYASEPDIPVPDIVIPDGVDAERFSPSPTTRETNDVPIVGWVGNSAWGTQAQEVDVKGYRRLFEPTILELAARGCAVEPKVADPQINRIPFEEMPDFYRQLDVFICTSAMEGTPNPVLEAMACGVPVISTDVGIVPEIFGREQKRFIIDDPSPGNFADAVETLLHDEKLLRIISHENRAQALSWTWEIKTRDWWPFWERVVRRTMEPRNAIRREIYLRSLASLI
jgi:glycosyltransferase involved in cell wall biosynthesis